MCGSGVQIETKAVVAAATAALYASKMESAIRKSPQKKLNCEKSRMRKVPKRHKGEKNTYLQCGSFIYSQYEFRVFNERIPF